MDRVLVQGWSLTAAAEAAGVSVRTAWKWVDRFRREGEAGRAADAGPRRSRRAQFRSDEPGASP